MENSNNSNSIKSVRNILGYIIIFTIIALAVAAQLYISAEDRKQIEALRQETESFKNSLNTFEGDIEDKVDKLNEAITKLNENSDAHTKQIEGLNKMLENLKKELENKEEKLNERIDEVEQAKLEKRQAEEAAQAASYTASSYVDYTAPTSGLTPTSGVNWYGEQKETYYNLPMDGVLEMARANGIGGEYWIRDDGVKMLGDYVIVACNRDIHPYGSIIETSLGTGISLDTGKFAESNPYQCDIAVSW